MVVYNTGYLKKIDVEKLLQDNVKFAIYKTNKNTQVLVKYSYHLERRVSLYQPQHDRLPYKVVEGKKISYGELIFDSTVDSLDKLETSGWNNGNQIMSYEDYYLNY